MVLQMCAIGEESGSIDHMLRQKLRTSMKPKSMTWWQAFPVLMEPIIIVVLGTVIGGIVVAMYLPFSSSGGLMVVALQGSQQQSGAGGLAHWQLSNVVIHRLPQMEAPMGRRCAELSGQPFPTLHHFNLVVPRSRCPHCGHGIRWYENIPVFQLSGLRGRCSKCHDHQPALPIC